ncbi:hypothetical protein [Burkholderia pseudomallei]|uniref:hypothetical protein n=1 Tax=Burkholderia pseudomallei TaxID=28450 RepID=UPI0011C224E8|nr:hypothetical protein [Burkholderia pseudomallei]
MHPQTESFTVLRDCTKAPLRYEAGSASPKGMGGAPVVESRPLVATTAKTPRPREIHNTNDIGADHDLILDTQPPTYVGHIDDHGVATMRMTAELLRKLEALIALAEPRDRESASGYSVTWGTHASDQAVNDVLYGEPDRVFQYMADLSDEELVVVMALALFGNDKGGFGQGSTFEQALAYARSDFERDGRDRIVSYIGSKPLSKYLPYGLRRARYI